MRFGKTTSARTDEDHVPSCRDDCRRLTPAGAQNKDDTALSAGSFTSADQRAGVYLATVANLEAEQRGLVSSGRRMFNETWVLPTEYTGVWGVGPTFNENSCLQCHGNNGRARAPDHGAEAEKGLRVRVSVPGVTAEGGPNPHPMYGDQLQDRQALVKFLEL